MAEAKETTETDGLTDTESSLPICGIIMPIANSDGYPQGHWQNVYEILCDVAKDAQFRPNLVSFDDDVGVIHKRIVQNIYLNPIIICDISNRNPNVMFELGMRLAFDKPTIIVKDEKTPYSFDISSIEHIEYPSDLRYHSIIEFKEKLKHKISDTYTKSNEDPEFTTFLKHFGKFTIAQIDEKEVTSTEYLTAEIRELKLILSNLISTNKKSNFIDKSSNKINFNLSLATIPTLGITTPINLPDLGSFLKSNGVDVYGMRYSNESKNIFIEFLANNDGDTSRIFNLVRGYYNIME